MEVSWYRFVLAGTCTRMLGGGLNRLKTGPWKIDGFWPQIRYVLGLKSAIADRTVTQSLYVTVCHASAAFQLLFLARCLSAPCSCNMLKQLRCCATTQTEISAEFSSIQPTFDSELTLVDEPSTNGRVNRAQCFLAKGHYSAVYGSLRAFPH